MRQHFKYLKKVSNIAIEDAKIGFRNFSGKEGKYNPAGNRNFTVFLEPDLAKQLKEEGWNVRWLNPKDPDDDPQGILQVKVAFGNFPPKIILISGDKQSALNEENVNILDWADLETIDIQITPYSYNINGREGLKAYLKTLYAVLREDVFAKKYEVAPDSAQDSVGGCGNCEVCTGDCNGADHL